MNTYWTIEDLAKQLRVTTRTIRNYLKSGELSGSKIGGQWRFTPDDVRHLVGFRNPITAFSEHSTGPDRFEEAMIAFNIPIPGEDRLDRLRDRLVDQYNNVYSGPDRRFDYEVLSPQYARVVLTGSRQYVLSFGAWIEQQAYRPAEPTQSSEKEG